jgi:hypothetical protein
MSTTPGIAANEKFGGGVDLTGLAGIARRKNHPRIMRNGGDFVDPLRRSLRKWERWSPTPHTFYHGLFNALRNPAFGRGRSWNAAALSQQHAESQNGGGKLLFVERLKSNGQS